MPELRTFKINGTCKRYYTRNNTYANEISEDFVLDRGSNNLDYTVIDLIMTIKACLVEWCISFSIVIILSILFWNGHIFWIGLIAHHRIPDYAV